MNHSNQPNQNPNNQNQMNALYQSSLAYSQTTYGGQSIFNPSAVSQINDYRNQQRSNRAHWNQFGYNNQGAERGPEPDPRSLSPLIAQNHQKLFNDKYDYGDNQMNAQMQRKANHLMPEMTPQVTPRKTHFDVRVPNSKFDNIQRNLNNINQAIELQNMMAAEQQQMSPLNLPNHIQQPNRQRQYFELQNRIGQIPPGAKAANDSLDNQCDLSLSFLQKEDVDQYNIAPNLRRPNESGETVITRTMSDNLVPFQFKKNVHAINKAAVEQARKNQQNKNNSQRRSGDFQISNLFQQPQNGFRNNPEQYLNQFNENLAQNSDRMQSNQFKNQMMRQMQSNNIIPPLDFNDINQYAQMDNQFNTQRLPKDYLNVQAMQNMALNKGGTPVIDPQSQEYLQFKQFQYQKMMLEMKLQQDMEIAQKNQQDKSIQIDKLNSMLGFSDIQKEVSLDLDEDRLFDDKTSKQKDINAQKDNSPKPDQANQNNQLNDLLNIAKEQQRQQEQMQKEIERLKMMLVEKDKIINQVNNESPKAKGNQDQQKSVDDLQSSQSKHVSTDQERPKRSSIRKVESFRVRNNLINHVIDNGFPKFNQESKKDQNSDQENLQTSQQEYDSAQKDKRNKSEKLQSKSELITDQINDMEQDHKFNNSPKTQNELGKLSQQDHEVNKNISDSCVGDNQNVSNSKKLNGSLQKVFTFVHETNSKEIKRQDIFKLDGPAGQNADKSASNISSSDHNLSQYSNRDFKQNKERELSYSQLGLIMKKWGLTVGNQTGLSLNNMIITKPSSKELDKDSQSSAQIEHLLMTEEKETEYWQIIKQSIQRQQECADEDLTDEQIIKRVQSMTEDQQVQLSKIARDIVDQKNMDINKKKAAGLKNAAAKSKSQKVNDDNKDRDYQNIMSNIGDDKPLSPKSNPHTPHQTGKGQPQSQIQMNRSLPNSSEFKTPEAVPRNLSTKLQMRGEAAITRDVEKTYSDISALSAFGPSMDRVNNQQNKNRVELISVTTPINAHHEQEVNTNSDYSCNIIPNREVEKSVSDFSTFSAQQVHPITPPPSKFRRRIHKAGMQDDSVSNISGYSAMQVQTFNSNNRKQELSVSDNTSMISGAPRSPFLQLRKEPIGEQKAGKPFEFILPVTFASTNIASSQEKLNVNQNFNLNSNLNQNEQVSFQQNEKSANKNEQTQDQSNQK